MNHERREAIMREADRLVEAARARAAAKVREQLGPSPAERQDDGRAVPQREQ